MLNPAMQNYNELPDIMYFGSSKQMDELKGRVFLTPHIGIASLFIIDTNDLFRSFPKGYKISCNISYDQWACANELLAQPLDVVDAHHNIPTFSNTSSCGQSSGYIHVIDISNVKDKMSLFTTNNPDREVIYNGEEPLNIIKRIPHTLKWNFTFCPEDAKRHGAGTAEQMEITIRLAKPEDVQHMAEVLMRSWEVAYKDIFSAEYIREKNATRPALFRRVITDDNTEAFVIMCGSKVVGIMRVALPQDDDVDDAVYELHYIYLHPDYFRRGIGTKAMKFAFDIAKSKGKTVMYVWVISDNVNSIRFYEKCGFIPDGKVMDSACGKVNGRIRMRKNL
ncbi:MAG: GNAT family N-acetyltransferase [Firmicutes bacterium]|nr:GNAT family N-acetyltransferase [Bacillota bacterium]